MRLLSQKLEAQPERASEGERRRQRVPGPNRDRLTVGVDLGDQWSSYCILDLDGERLTEGELGTTQQDFAEFFQSLAVARVVMEVGTHSALGTGCRGGLWTRSAGRQFAADERAEAAQAQERSGGCAQTSAGWANGPQSLFPIEHRSVEVRQDLVALRARDAVVAVRRDVINTARGLVKGMGARLPKCSSESFSKKVEGALAAEVSEVLLPLVRLVETLSSCIAAYDERSGNGFVREQRKDAAGMANKGETVPSLD